MNRLLILITGCLALFTASITPAHATPSDVIDIHEEPFGVSPTHLFLTRTLSDNLGLHESLRVETFLVAIDLESGVERVWVLDRMTQSRDYAEDGEQLDYVTKRDEGQKPINPYVVLTEHGAVPWGGVARAGEGWDDPQTMQDDGAITVSYGEDAKFHVSAEALASKLESLHKFMAGNVADHPRMSSISTRDIFAERDIPVSACTAREVRDYWSMRKGPGKLLRVVCSTGDDDGVTSMFVQLEAVAVEAKVR